MNGHWLKHSITFLQWRHGLTWGREVKQNSPSLQWWHPLNDKENIPTIPTTQLESKRSTHTPTPATIIDESTQTVKQRIHNNIPPRKWRSHSKQKGNTHNHHQQSTSAPRMQRRRRQTLDSDSNQEQQGRNQQCIQLTIDQTKRTLPPCIGRIPSWKQMD